jgi:hypothetical protein
LLESRGHSVKLLIMFKVGVGVSVGEFASDGAPLIIEI